MRSVVIGLGCLVVVAAACRNEPEPAPAPAPEANTPAQVSQADFQGLRWLEGHWRGTGGGVDPFYEGYRFANDTTIIALMYADSTLAAVADSGAIVLSGGVLTSRGANSLSTATEIDSAHVRFVMQDRGNTFTWTRDSDTSWTAYLTATILGDAQERTYQMQRIEGPAAGE